MCGVYVICVECISYVWSVCHMCGVYVICVECMSYVWSVCHMCGVSYVHTCHMSTYDSHSSTLHRQSCHMCDWRMTMTVSHNVWRKDGGMNEYCNTLQHAATAHCSIVMDASINSSIMYHCHICGGKGGGGEKYQDGHILPYSLSIISNCYVCSEQGEGGQEGKGGGECALPHTAIHCNTLQYSATYCNKLQHWMRTATHCNTLQYSATYCNTLQRTATH